MNIRSRIKSEWNGERISQGTIRGLKRAVDGAMAAGVAHAKREVPRDTTNLQGSIKMDPAIVKGNNVVGQYGSYNCNYALHVEYGTRPHRIEPKTKKALYWPGADHPVKSVMHPGTKPHPFLRPSADIVAEKLKDIAKVEIKKENS